MLYSSCFKCFPAQFINQFCTACFVAVVWLSKLPLHFCPKKQYFHVFSWLIISMYIFIIIGLSTYCRLLIRTRRISVSPKPAEILFHWLADLSVNLW